MLRFLIHMQLHLACVNHVADVAEEATDEVTSECEACPLSQLTRGSGDIGLLCAVIDISWVKSERLVCFTAKDNHLLIP